MSGWDGTGSKRTAMGDLSAESTSRWTKLRFTVFLYLCCSAIMGAEIGRYLGNVG
jgi:hypothetical protein